MAENITSVLDRLERASIDRRRVAVADLLHAFSGRLFGPMLLVPALIVITPVGMIPFVPSAMAMVLVLIAGQRVLGSAEPWVPRRLRERSVSRARMVTAFGRLRPWAQRVDRLLRPRLDALTSGPMQRALSLVVVLLAAIMVPLELVPFAAALPALAIVLLALSLTANDGLFGVAGLAVAGGAFGLLLLV